jgi:hypothetical protein
VALGMSAKFRLLFFEHAPHLSPFGCACGPTGPGSWYGVRHAMNTQHASACTYEPRWRQRVTTRRFS